MPLDDNSLNNIGHHPDPPLWASSTPNITTSSGAPTNPGVTVNDVNIDITTGDIYVWDGAIWNLMSGGGGGGTPEVFSIAGAGTPGAAPTSGAGVAYNASGNLWVYSGGAWVQQF